MEWYFAFLLLLGSVCLLMFNGLPVAFAFFAANIIGTFIFIGGDIGLVFMPMEFHNSIKYTLSAVPLFVLMGALLLHTGVAFRAIDAIDRMISRVPGRLSVVAVVGGTVFSSLSGSTIANTATLGSVLMPEMIRRGYSRSISMGPIMAVGGIAMLIPPSALAVLLASMAEQSIAKLLIAGIVPGVLMAILFFLYVILKCYFVPSEAPSYVPDQSRFDKPLVVSLGKKNAPFRTFTYDGKFCGAVNRLLPFSIYVMPLGIIFAVVVGSIFLKIAAPTESAALGCVAAIAACYMFRGFSKFLHISSVEPVEFEFSQVWEALKETAKISVMILFIIAGSLVFSQALANSGATAGLLNWIISTDLTPFGAVLIMMAVLLFLGAFMDQVSMLLLTLPFFFLGSSSLQAVFDIDPTWLMVLMLITMEIGLLTPPFGLLLYVMKGVAPFDVRIGEVIRAAMPFILIELFVLGLLIAFPAIATWLPDKLG